MGLKSYRELLVWQKGIDLAVRVYKLTSAFPDNEKFGLVSQMRRAGYSISSNIAEGYGRKDSKDFTRFLKIALGSSYELQTQVEIAKRIGFVNDDTFCVINNDIDEVGKMLNTLIVKRSKA